MNPTNVLIIEPSDYERNVLIRSLVRDGHSVYDARTEMDAIDVVLCLSSHHKIEVIIDFDSADKGHTLINLLNLCGLKFGTIPFVISNNSQLNVFKNYGEAVI